MIHFEFSFQNDCQVCHIELVEMLAKPDSKRKSPSTSPGRQPKNFKMNHYLNSANDQQLATLTNLQP